MRRGPVRDRHCGSCRHAASPPLLQAEYEIRSRRHGQAVPGQRLYRILFSCLREGEIGAGDEIVRMHQDENRVSISEILKVYLGAPHTDELRARALRVEYLSASWREELSVKGQG